MYVPVHTCMIPSSSYNLLTEMYSTYHRKIPLKQGYPPLEELGCIMQLVSWSVRSSKSEFETKSRANESNLLSETPLVRLAESHSLRPVPTVNADAEAVGFWQ